MRSARYFAADYGIKLSKQDAKESSESDSSEDPDAAENGTRSRTARDQRPKPDWFLHDDRDMDPGPPRRGGDMQGKENQRGRSQPSSGWDEDTQDARGESGQSHSRGGGGGGGGGRGRERTAKPHVPGRTLPLLPPSAAWHYIDPEGKEQGPFDAKKLINWVDLGYFGQSDLQVKKAGKDAWVSLSDALPQIRKEAAGDFSLSLNHPKESLRAIPAPGDDQPGKGRGRGVDRGGGRAARPARRPQQEVDDLLPVMPEGKRHPAEGLLSPTDESGPPQRSHNRRGADRVTPGPEHPSRADQYSAAEQGGRGSRGRGKATRGGRAARADNAELDSRADQGRASSHSGRVDDPSKAPSGKVAWRLFSADRQGAEEPVWRYIDPDGHVQGPFSAREMHTWYESNYLQMELPICGMERKVSPPDLPPKELYKSMGQMMQQVIRGNKFRPVTVKDVATAIAAKNARKAQYRSSNDGAESVEAKQETFGAEEEDAEDAGINLDAESVHARGEASEDDSDMEEGEIHGKNKRRRNCKRRKRRLRRDKRSMLSKGVSMSRSAVQESSLAVQQHRSPGRTAATDEESDFDPEDDDGSVSSPRRPVQNQAASSTESPERPVSPQKAEAKATFRQPASPEPVHEAAAPSSPEKPASPERPEAHAARTQAASAVQPDASSSSSSNTVAHQSADISMPSDPVVEQASHKGAQAAEPRAGDMIVEEPEEEEQAVAKEEQEEQQKAAQQGDNTDAQESMQIEELSQQDGQQGMSSSSQQGDTGGVVGAMMGAAKSLFVGGKHDEQETQQGADGVDATQEPQTSNAQAPMVEEPDTTESEVTADSYHSDQAVSEVHGAAISRSNSGADDIGPGEDSIAQVQEGINKVNLDDH